MRAGRRAGSRSSARSSTSSRVSGTGKGSRRPRNGAGPARAGVTPDDIDVVYAAANGSVVLDRTEARAIAAVFGARPVTVAAVKGALGESGAAGCGAMAAHLLLADRALVPPTVGLVQRGPDTPAGASNGAQPLRGPRALVTGVGSGGTVVAVVVEAATA